MTADILVDVVESPMLPSSSHLTLLGIVIVIQRNQTPLSPRLAHPLNLGASLAAITTQP
jgi:hypothetical protein